MMNLNNTKRIYLGAVVAVVILTSLLFLLPRSGILITAYIFAIAGLAGFTLALHWASCRRQGLYVTTAAVPLLIFNYLVFDLILGTLVVAAYHFNIFRMSVGWFIFAELLLAGIFIWKLLALDAGREMIEAQEVKIREKTSRWKEFEIELSNLHLLADREVKNAIGEVKDAVRFSDPVSDSHLAEIEEKIAAAIVQLGDLVKNHQNSDIPAHCQQLQTNIKIRNTQCRSHK